MNKYSIEPVTQFDEWNLFVEKSPQGTIFSRQDYLLHAVENFALHWIKKGNQIKAGLCIVLSEDKCRCVLDDLVIYNGILFAEDPQRKITKARSERFAITEFVIEWLTQSFNSVELALAPQFEDMRPFLWHNYSSRNPIEKFELDLRYTSYLDTGSLAGDEEEEDTSLFRELETLRQRNIREARKQKASINVTSDHSLLVSWYRDLMHSQGEPQEEEKIQRMDRLIRFLMDNNQGVLFTGTNVDGEALYSVVFCWDSKRAYYLFGAPNPSAKERYKGTIVFWDGLRHLALGRSIREVDFEGVNSPQRGSYKLSFGGTMQSYYEVRKHVKSNAISISNRGNHPKK